jgi:DNA-binding NtrC family response regulator
MVRRRNVLIVDDVEERRNTLVALLGEWGYGTEAARGGQEAMEKLKSLPIHVVLADLTVPWLDTAALLRWMADLGNAPPAIVVDAYRGIGEAVSKVHDLGAFWFLDKPLSREALRLLVARAADHGGLAQERELLRRHLAYSGVLGEMVGRSPVMQQVFALIQQVAPKQTPVLISGESGVGKELAARNIHQLSLRRFEPFVAIDCAALPDSLLETELFGYETGSDEETFDRRPGCFELAQGGTLLVDQIAEMPPGLQAKFVRVLESGRVQRRGAKGDIPVDVRILAATARPLEAALNRGELRHDLYHRLNVLSIPVPPLRERKEDLPILSEALLPELNRKNSCRVSGVTPEVMEHFERYNWPGNVRELRSVLQRAAIVAKEGLITLAHLPADFLASPSGRSAARPAPMPRPGSASGAAPFQVGWTVAETERQLILQTLAYAGSNKTRTALILGISLKTLHNKLKKYGLKQAA